MISLSPIAHYQGFNKASAEEFYKAVRTGWMTATLTAAMAELAYGGATSDELSGARKFVKTFMNMAEEIPKPTPPLPDKNLVQPASKPEDKK